MPPQPCPYSLRAALLKVHAADLVPLLKQWASMLLTVATTPLQWWSCQVPVLHAQLGMLVEVVWQLPLHPRPHPHKSLAAAAQFSLQHRRHTPCQCIIRRFQILL